MKRMFVFSFVFLFALATGAYADFTLVRTFGTPGATNALTGLDNADGVLFAVENLGPDGSCMYLIDPANGEVLREACLTDDPPGCPEQPPQYVSCAFRPWENLADDSDALCEDTYVVGDVCGDIIRYLWSDTYGPILYDHCMPDGIVGPVGMVYHNGYIHYIDSGELAIFRLENCFGQPPDGYHLPDDITEPSALTVYEGNFFVGDSGMDVLYEIGDGGAVVDIHELEGFHPLEMRALTGLAFIGDELFVASDDDEILVYQFASFGVDVPEGDSIVVEPVPDELEVGFPTVVDSGSLYVHVSGIDTCPPPEGVVFLPDFYEIMTTAAFEYAAQIAIMTDEPLPPGIDPRKVRIFARPSGDCEPYMDITTAPIQFFEPEGERTFRVRTRTVSEDDEFSVFILGEDHRNPVDVIAMKFMYLEEAIDAVGGTPVDPYEEMLDLLARAGMAFANHRYARAAMFVDMIAEVALATPEIPHIYDPDMPGANLGGRIVARAHTLSFSIRLLVRPEQVADGSLGPMFQSSARPSENLVLSPNPSTSGFTMWLSPRGMERVSLRVFSVKGELVRTLIDNEHLAGPRTLTWDGTNANGLPVAAGTYFAVYTEGEQAITKKLILQR